MPRNSPNDDRDRLMKPLSMSGLKMADQNVDNLVCCVRYFLVITYSLLLAQA